MLPCFPIAKPPVRFWFWRFNAAKRISIDYKVDDAADDANEMPFQYVFPFSASAAAKLVHSAQPRYLLR
jgi:hypothetical protein